MRGSTTATVRFAAFALVMVLLSAFLFMIFGQYQTGSTASYSAVFADASRLRSGDSVRIAGIRVGTVEDVSLQSDGHVVVTFNADRGVAFTTGVRAAIRYLNLVGDRYLEILNSPGSTQLMPPGSQIPLQRTAPALDLDLLLGGLKPVIQGLNPQDVNALTSSLLAVLQGQGGTLESLLSKTSSFSNALADNHEAVEQLIDHLNTVLKTLGQHGDQFSGAIDSLENLVSGLAADRDPIGTAIKSLDNGTASIADLLTNARAPLAQAVNQLTRLAPLLDDDKTRIDAALGRAPENYRKLVRLGAYGSFVNYYICALTVRATDLQGRTVVAPVFKQTNGRCAEP
ncbi:MCE family protein [Mycobacterium palustre]|uniref:Mammalian cell entry protein n=1 Tax=Mycobacterium palustre TaxID=153971 RepID=A0A1X1ZU59_9MYCO|nr:MlaD family protein [Mycobacterium palustre]MCV7101044.1 MCE family protein [Mycobacterium palustre]ORW27481.1 mammalian cell entry protein [Mycobacterium palustre]